MLLYERGRNTWEISEWEICFDLLNISNILISIKSDKIYFKYECVSVAYGAYYHRGCYHVVSISLTLLLLK